MPPGMRIVRYGIVKVGEVTTTTIRDMKAAWKDLERRSRLASAEDGLTVPERYREGVMSPKSTRASREEISGKESNGASIL